MSKMFFTCLSYRLHVAFHHDLREFLHLLLLLPLLFSHFLLVLLLFLFHRFFLSIPCLRLQLFSLIFSMISWYLFFELRLLFPSFFASLILSVMFCCLELFFLILREPSFFGEVITNVAMTHLWSLPMWIMSLASASLLYFKCHLLIMM